jgi:hypothetical protein
VGDFTEDELERCLLKYLGTLSAKPETKPEEFATLEVPFQVVPTYDPTRRNQKVRGLFGVNLRSVSWKFVQL